MGKIAMLDVSESGRQIGEKLFAVLDPEQQKELTQYIFERDSQSDIDNPIVIIPNHDPREHQEHPLTKIYEGDLYFCLEQRVVCVRDQEIDLTAKEFDILALLIMNPKRVFTYEMIIDIVWHEDCDYYSRKAINNHVSNLRKKLKVESDVPDYIKSVHSVGNRAGENNENPKGQRQIVADFILQPAEGTCGKTTCLSGTFTLSV